MLLGFTGKAGSGKNTAAKIVSEEIGNCVEVSFAAPLRDLLGMCLGLTEEQVQSTYREDVKALPIMRAFPGCRPDFHKGWWDFCDKHKIKIGVDLKMSGGTMLMTLLGDLQKPITVRKLLQVIGTDFVRDQVDPDLWVKITMDAVYDNLISGKNVLVTDVRFPNEAQAITLSGGQVFEIQRPSLVTKDNHKSEEPLQRELIDFVILNDRGIEELKEELLSYIRG